MDSPTMQPGQDHWWPIGPARPIVYPADGRLAGVIRQLAEDNGCPVCQLPVPVAVLAAGETAHPACRARNAGKFTYRDSEKKGRVSS